MNDYCEFCRQGSGHQYPLLASHLSEPRSSPHLLCPECERQIELVDIATAAAVLGKSHRTIHEWIKKGWVKTVNLTDGRSMIIYSTLFRPPSLPEDSQQLEPTEEN